MSADFRRECIGRLSDRAKQRIRLPELDREYTLGEIATITSAGPARALGLPQKGHLGVGADADLVIYDEDPDIVRMFGHPRYVIKGGQIVVEEGDIRATPHGREFLVKPAYDEAITDYLQPLFEDYYTMAFENYPVEIKRVENADIRDCVR